MHEKTKEHMLEHCALFLEAQDEAFEGNSTERDMLVGASAYISALVDFADISVSDGGEIINLIEKQMKDKYPSKFGAIQSPFK